MPYPEEILPGPPKKIIDCTIDEYFFIRHTSTNVIAELQDEETGFLKISQVCSPDEKIDDLSGSLLSIFQPPHLELEFTEEGKPIYMHYCPPDDIVPVPEEAIHFFLNPNRHFWQVRIGDINNVVFDYTRGKDPFRATCLVVHSPMKWNFWHLSVRWKLDGVGPLEEQEEKERRKIAKRIGHSARVIFAKFAKITLPDIAQLNPACYLQN